MAAPLITSSQIPAPIQVGSRVPQGTPLHSIIDALAPLKGRVTRNGETRATIDAGSIVIYRMLGTSLALGRRSLPITVSITSNDGKASITVSLRDTVGIAFRIRSEGDALNERVAEINRLLNAV